MCMCVCGGTRLFGARASGPTFERSSKHNGEIISHFRTPLACGLSLVSIAHVSSCCLPMLTRMYMPTQAYTYIYTYIHVYVYTCIYTYIYSYVYTCIFIYKFIHTNITYTCAHPSLLSVPALTSAYTITYGVCVLVSGALRRMMLFNVGCRMHTHRHRHRQTDRQTDTHTHTHNCTHRQ